MKNETLVLEKYEIIKSLQENYIGGRHTYLARRKEVVDKSIRKKKLVVIKQFRFAQSNSSWKGYKQLEDEIKILKRLEHPCIPKYIETINHSEGLCLVTEYVEGNPLSQSHLPSSKIKDFARKMLDLLVYLQESNPPIIHRDIKPENIIISPDGEVHLIDFGLSSIASEMTLSISSSFGGTLGYMPLEQVLKGKVNSTTDVYALGVVIFSLLNRETSLREVLDSRNLIPVEMVKDKIDYSALKWLKCILAEKVSDRYPNARSAKKKLETMSSLSWQVNSVEHRQNYREKFRQLWKGVVIVAVIVAGGILVWLGLPILVSLHNLAFRLRPYVKDIALTVSFLIGTVGILISIISVSRGENPEGGVLLILGSMVSAIAINMFDLII